MLRLWIISLCFLAWPAAVSPAMVPVEIRPDPDLDMRVSPIEYLKDADGSRDFSAVLHEEHRWRPIGDGRVNFGYSHSVFWFRFFLKNNSLAPAQVLIELDYPRIDQLDLYTVSPSGELSRHQSGTALPFSAREVDYRLPAFDRQLDPGLTRFFLRVQSSNSLGFQLRVSSPRVFIERVNREMPYLWIYYGFMLALIIMNTVLYNVTGDRAMLLCAIFIAFFTMLQLDVTGLSFQYLWPDHPGWYQRSPYFLLCLGTVFLVLFILAFTDATKHFPTWRRLFLYSTLIPAGFLSFGGLLLNGPFSIAYKTTVQLWGAFYSGAIGAFLVYGTLKRNREAAFLLGGLAAMLLGGVIYILKNLGMIPITPFTTWSWQTGSFLMILIFSLGIIDRFNLMKRSLQKSEESLRRNVQQLEATNESLQEANIEYRLLNEKLSQSYEEIREKEREFSQTLDSLPVPMMLVMNDRITHDHHQQPQGIHNRRIRTRRRDALHYPPADPPRARLRLRRMNRACRPTAAGSPGANPCTSS